MTLWFWAKANTVHLSTFKYFNVLGVVDPTGTGSVTSAEREVAHLALDPARNLAPAARRDPLFQNLGENRLMKRFPRLRGE